MANFSPEFLNEIRERVALEDVVGRRVKLVRRGREYVGLSPFQKEKTPSFTVVPEKGFFKCFSSGESGDVFAFLMKVEGLSFREAVERLAAEAGLEVPAGSPEDERVEARRKTLRDALEAACAFFERTVHMPEGKAGMDYLTRRGLTPETIGRFRLGYAPGARGAMKAALARAGIDDETAAAAGLVRKSERDGHEYDYFRDRVIFPILDRQGHVIAFGGRTLGDAQPKYLNSPESPVFEKRRVLYGLAQALPTVRTARAAIVVEGYMDVIALHQAGFETAVAPLGTALTDEQLTMLWRVAPEPVLCFDGDNAGQRAAGRVAEHVLPLLRPGYGVRFALLPGGEDPDSLIKARGRKAMDDVLAATLPLSEVLWRAETQGRTIATPEDRAALEDRLRRHARQIEDASVRGHFIQGFRDRLWREARAGRDRDRGRGRDRDRALTDAVSVGRGPTVDRRHRAEQMLAAIMLRRPELFERVGEQFGIAAFADPGIDALRQAMVDLLDSEPDLDADGLARRLEARDLGETAGGLFRDPIVGGFAPILKDAPLDDILALWNEKCAERQAESLDSERNRVKEALADDPSEAEWERGRSRIQAVLKERNGG